MALYTLVAWILPELLGITIVLSLAGVTGIIVSVGCVIVSMGCIIVSGVMGAGAIGAA